jgi:uncharacterized membrane protein YkoI
MRPACLPLLLALAVPALADDDLRRARGALEPGEVLSFGAILEVVARRCGGRVVEVELERDDGRWLHELGLVTGDGRLMELEMYAARGAVPDA